MDVQGLIDKVMDSLRKKHGDTDKVYTDEAILRPASRMENYLPPIYEQMKALARKSAYELGEEELFYRQGMLLAQQEDCLPYSGQFLRYRPTYRVLTDAQLRGYVTWRADVRKGIVNKTALTFVYLYLYELLCHIGVQSAEDAYDAFGVFLEAYRQHERLVPTHIETWLKDLWIYDQPQRKAPVSKGTCQTEQAIACLYDPSVSSEEELYTSIDVLTGHYLSRSRFAKEYTDDMRRVVCGVYRALLVHYEKRYKMTYPERLFGKSADSPYTMFFSAVFYRPEPHPDSEVIWSPLVRYVCKNGAWHERRLCSRITQSRELTQVVRQIDAVMRRAYGYKYPLKETDGTKTVEVMLEAEIAWLRKEQQEAARRVVHIDVSKLEGIRKAAEDTRNSLLVEEFDAVPLFEQTPVQETSTEDSLPLTAEEHDFLRCLLTGADAGVFVRERRLMPSVLADSINEKLFDVFGDTVLDCTGDAYSVIEDYFDELREMLKL